MAKIVPDLTNFIFDIWILKANTNLTQQSIELRQSHIGKLRFPSFFWWLYLSHSLCKPWSQIFCQNLCNVSLKNMNHFRNDKHIPFGIFFHNCPDQLQEKKCSSNWEKTFANSRLKATNLKTFEITRTSYPKS